MAEKKQKLETTKKYFSLQFFWIKKYLGILLFTIIIGIVSGFVMVGFRFLLLGFQVGFSFLPYFLNPIIAGTLTSLTVKLFGLERIMGTGAAEFVEDLSIVDLESTVLTEKQKVLSSAGKEKLFVAKTFATSWTFGSGMVCGLEGPGLLIGSNLGHLLAKSKKFRIQTGDAFFMGASACTGAILRAPISGALFCAELPYNNFLRYRSLIPSILASSISYLIFSLFFTFSPLIEIKNPEAFNLGIDNLIILPLLITFGILTGLFTLLFISFLRSYIYKTGSFFEKYEKIWLLPFLGALGYSIFLFIVIPLIPGGYDNAVIHPDSTFLNFLMADVEGGTLNWILFLTLFFLFLITIFLSIGMQNSAGIILPLILIGALLGSVFGMIFYPQNPALFTLVGISAVLGAAINNPITAIVILIEMTWAPYLFFPAGITTIIAFIFSGPNSLIPQQRYVRTTIE